MSLSLLAPLGLLALLGMLLPLLVHLSRRNAPQRVSFAALRWLRIQTRARRRVRLHEWGLLLLRLLLVLLLALLLASPMLTRVPAADLPWIVVVPGSAPITRTPGARWHWLSPGFPDYAQAEPAPSTSLSSLLRELDAQLPAGTSLTVLAPAYVHGLDGARSELSRSVQLRLVLSRAAPSVPRTEPARVRVALFADPGVQASARYFQAAAAAWKEPDAGEPTVELTVRDPAAEIDIPPADWLIWLKPGSVPPKLKAWLANGGTLLLSHEAVLPAQGEPVALWQDDAGAALLLGSAFGNGRLLQWTRALSPATLPQLLEADFPQRLRAALQKPQLTPDYAPSSNLLSSTRTTAQPLRTQPLSTWLATLICVLWLLERWLASSPRRVVQQ